MKLKTSSCKLWAVKKDLTRFAPVWVLYLLLLLLVAYSNVLGPWAEGSAYARAMTEFQVIYVVIYAGCCALALFGYLTNIREASAFHSMPLSRNQWFGIHVLSGYLFLWIPMIPAGLLYLLGGYRVGMWVLDLTLMFTFFFGLAVCSMMLAGSRFAGAALYSIFNFAAVVLYYFTLNYIQPLLYGVVVDVEPFAMLSPPCYLVGYGSWHEGWRGGFLDRITGSAVGVYLVVLAVAGLVLLGISWLLYRKRHLECAGDFLAFRWMNHVFSPLFSLGAGMVLGTLMSVIEGDGEKYPFLFIGIVIGYFVCQMLLKRTVKVFKPRALVEVSAICAATGILVAGMWGCRNIWARSVPQVSEVESVSVGGWYGSVEVTDTDGIETVLAFHQMAVEHTVDTTDGGDYFSVSLEYQLTSGKTMRREYSLFVDWDAPDMAEMKKLLSRPESVLGNSDSFLEKTTAAEVYLQNLDLLSSRVYDQEQVQSLVEAILADCEEGTMCQYLPDEDYYLRRDCWIYLWNADDETGYLAIPSDAEHTIAWIEDYADTD